MNVLNNTVTRLTGHKAIDAFLEKEVDLKQKKYDRPVGFDQKRLDPLSQVRCLLRPGEEEGGETRRETDPIWSWKIFDLEKSVISVNQPVLYYIANGPKRSFVREELQVVPMDTEKPPEFVLK